LGFDGASVAASPWSVSLIGVTSVPRRSEDDGVRKLATVVDGGLLAGSEDDDGDEDDAEGRATVPKIRGQTLRGTRDRARQQIRLAISRRDAVEQVAPR